jgi:hypothetical protein
MWNEIATYCAKTFLGKAVDWAFRKRVKKGQLQFYEPALTYSFSFYDRNDNHILAGGTKKIYLLQCSVTVYNNSESPKLMRNTRLIGKINKKIFVFYLYDDVAFAWKSHYSVPGTKIFTFSWHAFLEGFGFIDGEPGMIPLNPADNEILFELCYIDEKERECKIFIESIESRRMNPYLIVAS